MTMQVRQGSTWRTITGVKVFKSGAWRSLVAVKVYASGAWRTVATFATSSGGGSSSLTLTLSNAEIVGSGSASSITALAASVTPSGGHAPYSYLWSLFGTDGLATYTINSPTVATTNVTASGIPTATAVECSVRCVVTDSIGSTATSGIAVCSFVRFGAPPQED